MNATDLLLRMEQTMNAHDLDGFIACFTEDFVSDVPLQPKRSFVGRETARENWRRLFAHVPDLTGRVLQSAADGDQVWGEWEISGNTQDGKQFLTRGVTILRLRGEQFASVRFYLHDVQD